MMRAINLAIVILLLAAPLHAQSRTADAPLTPSVERCRPFDAPPFVIMTLRDGRKLRGTLTCLGDEAELASEGKLSRTSLTTVAKIAEPRDPIWDGPVIGAGFGALMWAICGRGCDGAYMARATVDYALMGLVIDAATSHNKTIYKASRSPALSFRIRF
jgi:hypothetical protein